MSEWIECGLPWYCELTSSIRPKYEYPDLDDEMRRVLGYTQAELEMKHFGTKDCRYVSSDIFNEFYSCKTKIERDLMNEGITDERFSKETNRRLAALNNENVNNTLEFFRKYKVLTEWIKAHPLTKLANEHNDKLAQEANKNRQENATSFTGRGLVKSGVLMEVKAGDKISQILIGDINEAGGSCDDCRGISDRDIVVRYKRIWEK
jgi:hypothetical protein